MQDTKISLDKISLDEIYTITGIKKKTSPKKTKKIIIDTQLEQLMRNRNITKLVKDLYNEGKSHKNIASVLNKICKAKFTKNEKGKIPVFNQNLVLYFCNKKKIGDNKLRLKNLTKDELAKKNKSKRVELIRNKKNFKWDTLPQDIKKKIEEFCKKDPRDLIPEQIYQDILISEYTPKKYSIYNTTPEELVKEVRNISGVDESFYTIS